MLRNTQTIIIKKDILYFLLTHVAFVVFFLVLSYYYAVAVTDIEYKPQRAGRFFWPMIPVVIFVILRLIYHLITFNFKTIVISREGINDKMSMFFPEYIPFEKVNTIGFKDETILITLKTGREIKYEHIAITNGNVRLVWSTLLNYKENKEKRLTKQ